MLGNVYETLATRLTLPGLNHSAKTKGTRAKAWFFLGLVGIAVTTIQVVRVTENYYTYPYNTKIYFDHEKVMAFPSVWVCQFRKLHCGNLWKTANSSARSDDVGKLCNLLVVAGCKYQLPQPCANESLQIVNETEVDKLSLDERETLMEDILLNMKNHLRQLVTLSPYDVVVDCRFNGENCSYAHISFWFPTNYGPCFMFNYFGNLSVNEAQSYAGLELVVRLDVDDILDVGSNGNRQGVKVIITSPMQPPRFSQSSFDVSPNTATTFALEKQTRELLAKPYYSKCIQHWNQTKTNMPITLSGFFSNIEYDEFFCADICQLEATFTKCGECLWRKYDRIGLNSMVAVSQLEDVIEKLDYCVLNNATVSDCLNEHIIDDPLEACGCWPKCNSTDYGVQMSSAKWPSEINWRELAEKYNISQHPDPVRDETDRWFKEDIWWKNRVFNSLMKISIFFRSKKNQIMSEEPKYPRLDSFLVDLGGSLSIYMGLSFVFVAELAFLAVDGINDLLTGVITKKKKENKE